MLMGLKKDVDTRDEHTRRRLDEIKQCVNRMVTEDEYKADKKEVVLRLDEHGDRLLVLEIRVKDKT
jgi:hypothetical protein